MSEAMRYRKKPVVIEAMHWGADPDDIHKIVDWATGARYFAPGEWDAGETTGAYIAIVTLEGTMLASPNDWIIRGIQGEFYPCKPDIFAATYEAAE